MELHSAYSDKFYAKYRSITIKNLCIESLHDQSKPFLLSVSALGQTVCTFTGKSYTFDLTFQIPAHPHTLRFCLHDASSKEPSVESMLGRAILSVDDRVVSKTITFGSGVATIDVEVQANPDLSVLLDSGGSSFFHGDDMTRKAAYEELSKATGARTVFIKVRNKEGEEENEKKENITPSDNLIE